MTVTVDFVQGADAVAPGLSRAQQGLLDALATHSELKMRPIRFWSINHRLLFPYAWGPLPARLLLGRAGLVHFASAWYAHLVPMIPTPSIVTCHDLISLSDLQRGAFQGKPHRGWHLHAAYEGMKRARFIVCDSRATANHVAGFAPGTADRLRVVYLGLSPAFRPGPVDEDALRRLGVRQPYVLYVGSEQERKNVNRLVSAIAVARRQIPDLSFVKVGWHQTEVGRASLQAALAGESMLDRTVILDSVTDQDLITLYRGATVTTLPSLQEGFGYPPLEAMACGCPAIVSDRDSLPEVTGGDALVVNPLDVRSIADAIERVVRDETLRAGLKRRGPVRASFFTWERAADAYAELYESARNGR